MDMIVNFLKLFFSKSQNEDSDFELKGTGSLEDDRDVRAIPLGAFQDQSKGIPDIFETDISKLPVFDQKNLGICVGCALANLKNWQENRNDLSKRFIYSMARIYAGQTTTSGHGTYPVYASKALTGSGISEIKHCPDDIVDHQSFCKIEVSEAMAENALIYKAKGYAFASKDFKSLARAIAQNGVVALSVKISGSKKTTGELLPGKEGHMVLAFGYDLKEGKVLILNSWGKDWGKGGVGFIDYAKFTPDQINSAIVFTDIPQNLLKEARSKNKKPSAKNISECSLGDKSQSVSDLQDCLKYEGFLDIGIPSDGVYGPKTALAVRLFKLKYGLDKYSDNGHFVSSKEVVKLKEIYPEQKQTYSKINTWAQAIQEKEGYFPPGPKFPKGSRSWRNKNPGNIKHVGQKRAVGKDDGGFAIFKSYEDGFQELKDMLLRCATGKSKVYSPDLTIAGFFAKYAPTNDGNNPTKYAEFVANRIGVDINTKIKDLI